MYTNSPKPIIGWREWLALPQLNISSIKAKVDTGARTSSLHAFDIESFEDRGIMKVRFNVHPIQRNSQTTISAQAALVEHRNVKSSTGKQTLRPVITTTIELNGASWDIELTLINRDAMGFRMLLGREALRRRYIVDPSRSFLAGKNIKANTDTNKSTSTNNTRHKK